MGKSWEKYTKKELLKLPQRKWEEWSEYDAVLFVNTRMKHDSGYNLFAIVGCIGGEPKEIAGYMDDFRLDVEDFRKDREVKIQPYSAGFDCSMHGVFRLHCARYRIIVHENVSTTCFHLKEIK